MKSLIQFFVREHLLVNFILIGVLVGGLFAWQGIRKEELPDIELDFIRITVRWSGASADQVDRYIVAEIEKNLQGISGIEHIRSTSRSGVATVFVDFGIWGGSSGGEERQEIIDEVKNAVQQTRLPAEVDDLPTYREFKSSRKAIIDLSIYLKGEKVLTTEGRERLQGVAYALEERLLSSREVDSVNRANFNPKRVLIYLDPRKLKEANLAISEVKSKILNNHLNVPIGTIEADWGKGFSSPGQSRQGSKPKRRDSSRPKTGERGKQQRQEAFASTGNVKVTFKGELYEVEALGSLVVRSDFDGNKLLLRDIATIESEFKTNTSLRKINGHESLRMTIVKASDVGIIEAVEAVRRVARSFESTQFKEVGFGVVLSDDESIDVDNRLSIISWNGLLGFAFIVLLLLLFLNFKASFWVAMGIPFCLGFTLLGSLWLGYSVNNITLAAVIIVMGMVVDDAIVVAENILRLRADGLPMKQAATEGTLFSLYPITASIITTCLAFTPLLFMTGRAGMMNQFLPPVIFLMLGASLLESVFLLPCHMNAESGLLNRLRRSKRLRRPGQQKTSQRRWFFRVEHLYGLLLERVVLRRKVFVLLAMMLLVGVGLFLFRTKMKFEMFPRQETTRVFITGSTAEGDSKGTTARKVERIEALLDEHLGDEVLNYETSIGLGRWGTSAGENAFRIYIELVGRNERTLTAADLEAKWKESLDDLKGFDRVRIFKSRRQGSQSGSALEIEVRENNDAAREALVLGLKQHMESMKQLTNVEVERQPKDLEYSVDFDRRKAARLGVSASEVMQTLRTIINGTTLYEQNEGTEEVDYLLTLHPTNKFNLERIMGLPVQGTEKHLIPLGAVVDVKAQKTYNQISRLDSKRTTHVYADLATGVDLTLLEVAADMERNVFPTLVKQHPTGSIRFGGEVKDARESKNQFAVVILLTIFLIYAVLSILFRSLLKPVLIILAIPYAFIGVVIALYCHQITVYGLFTLIGTLGLSGVVVNDAIFMLFKLDREIPKGLYGRGLVAKVAAVSKTRLRAVVLTTLTTTGGLFPTAYGLLGYDEMLSDMMLAMAWGLLWGTAFILFFIPVSFTLLRRCQERVFVSTPSTSEPANANVA